MNRGRYVAINVFLIMLIYQNVAALAITWRIVPHSAFPNLPILYHLFFYYGVFDGVQHESRRYHAFGLRERVDRLPRQPAPEMVDLEIYRYFPQPRGEAHRRLGFFGYFGRPARIVASYRKMAGTVRRLHNQSHPDDPMEQVFIYLSRWPVDPGGYDHRENESKFYLKGGYPPVLGRATRH